MELNYNLIRLGVGAVDNQCSGKKILEGFLIDILLTVTLDLSLFMFGDGSTFTLWESHLFPFWEVLLNSTYIA